MKKGDRGEDIQELQEALIAHGQHLPYRGVDGVYGGETLLALQRFQEAHGLELASEDGEVSEETLDKLGWDFPEDDEPLPVPPKMYSLEVFDLRDEPWETRVAKKFKRRGGKPVVRDPAQVTGITIHQTAAKYGVADYQLKAVGGDRRLALARRSLRVACHVMAFYDGFVAWPNPLDWYVHHGNGFNSFELGLEIDGNYPGIVGGRTWNGKSSTKVSSLLINAARAAVELLVIEGRKMGMPIEYIHAHRQSSGTRRDDPGEALWRQVVAGYAVPILGLKTEPARVLKDGRSVPKEWDPNGVGRY